MSVCKVRGSDNMHGLLMCCRELSKGLTSDDVLNMHHKCMPYVLDAEHLTFTGSQIAQVTDTLLCCLSLNIWQVQEFACPDDRNLQALLHTVHTLCDVTRCIHTDQWLDSSSHGVFIFTGHKHHLLLPGPHCPWLYALHLYQLAGCSACKSRG
jgi:hypothetical protein